MKKISLIKAITTFSLVIFVSASVIQCKKEGDIVKDLDRSFKGSADTTIYASFYESNRVSPSDITADVNDIVKFRGVQTILHEYCATSNCHGGPISPKFDSYADVMNFVTPGSPESSKLWEYLTTNNFDKAMPPVNSNHEMTRTDKSLIYNWIKNGAKERPDINDFRPAAIAIISSGCGSAKCHSQMTAAGGWARAGFIPGLVSSDTTQFTAIDPVTGVPTIYCQLSNVTKLAQVWTDYKDSAKKFYSDTVAFANFRPWKTFATPRSSLSTRGPLNTYDDILMDVMYPKSARSNNSVQYTNPVTLVTYYSKGNYLNVTSSLVSRIDSTLLLANPYSIIATGSSVYATAHQGDMAYSDGGLKSHEIALIKAWYFADPNIPAVWKYGINNSGIFKYRKTGNIIKQ